MASYAQDVKNELARIFPDDTKCLRAELLALLTVGTKKIDGRIEFASTNAATVRKVIILVKKFFPTIKPEVAAMRKKKIAERFILRRADFPNRRIKNFSRRS